ncbi:MAG: hypothetical protein R3321_12465, partial [Nitrososphaeraceae archaeon]|nr:hypothetical protein [Nitrososphaeraceae archaeon]
PLTESQLFPIPIEYLDKLHLFASNNPIYYNHYEQKIGNTLCMVYEGDINKFWLNSIQYGSSHAPFSPTWIFSAFLGIMAAKNLGSQVVIDIGSGDGRIAYCAKILGLESYSIEIDQMLVDLQDQVVKNTGINFHPICSDAVTFDYDKLDVRNPAFFIGGLAQMGGNSLANPILEKISSKNELKSQTIMVFAGTYSKKYAPDELNLAGWGLLISKHNLKLISTMLLPTVWTFRELDDTPYLFTKFS